MTFSQIQIALDDRADETIEATKKNRYINLAYQEVWGYTDLWPFRKTSTTVTITNGVGTLPSDYSKAIKVYANSLEYTPVAYQDRGKTGLSQVFYIVPQTDNNSAPTQIGVLSTSVTSITLEYERNLTELSASDDVPVFDKAFHELLVLGALKRYSGTERENSELLLAETQFTNMLSNMFDFLIGRESLDQATGMTSLAQQYNLDY